MQYTKEFNQCLNATVQSLNKADASNAINGLKSALNIETKIKSLFEQMKALEVDLKKLTKRGVKFLKKEKRKFS